MVRGVATLFPAEVDRGIARVFVLGRLNLRRDRPVLADETLQAGPRFNERAAGSEVFVAGPALLAREVIHFGEEEFGHVGGEDALVVPGEDAVVEAARTELAVEELEPEQIVAKRFAEEPLAANRVERGQHAGLEQLLERNAGASEFFVEIVKEGREFLQYHVQMALDRAQRMIGGHAGVAVDDGEKIG
jgi:hypothetical protein